MNNSCLYCFRELEEGQVDFHAECAINIFGCTSPKLDDTYSIRSRDMQSGYSPELGAVAIRLAQVAMILTQPSSLTRAEGGEIVLATKRVSSMESLSDLVERLDECEFDGSVEMVAQLVEDFSSIARLDLVNLFEQVIFAWIVGCTSLWLGSFALSRPNDGVCSLSPLFDLEPDLAKCREFTLTVNGRDKNIRRIDFEAAMRYMGLKDRIIRLTIEKMIKSREAWFEIIKRSPLEAEQQRDFIALIDQRLVVLS